jgi:predicted ATP-dependent serine protease
MPRAEIQQLIHSVSRLDGIELNDGAFSIDLRLPGRRPYLPSMGLAVATALIGAYLRLPIPADMLFIGEVDLAGGIRPAEMDVLNRLTGDVAAGLDLSEPRIVFCHPATAIAFYSADHVRVRTCKQLEHVVYAVWPSLR